MVNKSQSESWDKTRKELGPRQEQVYSFLVGRPDGLTAWDIADYMNRQVYTIRPRLTELKILGRIKEAGSKWHEATQRRETNWVICKGSKQLNLL